MLELEVRDVKEFGRLKREGRQASLGEGTGYSRKGGPRTHNTGLPKDVIQRMAAATRKRMAGEHGEMETQNKKKEET